MFLTWKKSSSVFVSSWSKHNNSRSKASEKLLRLLLNSWLVCLALSTAGLAAQTGSSNLAITSTTLPVATLGLAYNASIDISGGTAPYACSVAKGSLPPGLVMNGCSISGRLIGATSNTFAVRVTDASQPTKATSGSFKVPLTAAPLAFEATYLPIGTTGVAYTAQILILGGTAPYRCSTLSGSLPAGVALNGCSLKGTPAASGTGSVTVRVTDSQSPAATLSGTLSWTIKAGAKTAPLTLTGALPNGGVKNLYRGSISATGGTAPYACSLAGGSLPAGLVLEGCVITGTPSGAGVSTFALQLNDSASPAHTAKGSYNLVVLPSSLTIAMTSLTSGKVSVAYSDVIAAAGGTAPYRCRVTNGTLPSGLSLNGCTVVGTPKSAGSGAVVVQVSDSESPIQAVSASLPWEIAPIGALNLGTASLPKATVGSEYRSVLTISGGTAPYSCSAPGGLPDGLKLSGCSIVGVPAMTGSDTFQVQVTDRSSPAVSVSGMVALTVAPPKLVFAADRLSVATVNSPYTSNFSLRGGTAPYSCTILSGALPPGISLNGCIATGTPSVSGLGSVTLQVTDSESPAGVLKGNFVWTVLPATLALTTTALPNGTAAVFYTSTIHGSGGVTPYHCSIAAGALPGGLALNGCTVSGVPTAGAASSLTVQLTDSALHATSVTGPVTLAIASPVLTLATATLPTAVTGQSYAGSLTAVGGTAPYAYSISAGALPAGLTLSTSGVITGSPVSAGTALFTAIVTDASAPQMSASHTFSIAISAPALTLGSTTLPAAAVGQSYSAAIQPKGGTAPYTCALVSGNMPAGLTLNGCTITGTPSSPGTMNANIRAADSSTPVQSASGAITITVNPQALSINTAQLPAATVNVAYTGSVSVSGGVGAVSCSLAGGALPAGLQFNSSTCSVTGTPITAGTSSMTIVATDANTPQPDTASANLALNVNAGAMGLATAQLATPVLGSSYSQTLAVTGGTAPYSFAVTNGALPQGLTMSTAGVISGTPTAAGAAAFTVTVTDSESTPQTATQMYVPLVTYPAGANNAQMSGSFAFLVQGYDAASGGDLPYATATVGSFITDGAGLVKSGEMDTNHQSSTATSLIPTAHFIGTYEVGADDRGLLTITTMNADGTTGASSTFAIAAAAEAPASGSTAPADVAAAGGSPLLATGAPGMILMQDPTVFAQGLQGSYAFGLQGDTPCLLTCVVGVTGGPVAEVGEFTTGAGGLIASGVSDVNIGAVTNASAAVTGSFGQADANGRLQLTMNTANMPAGIFPTDYAAYVVNANEVLLMSNDTHSSYVLLSGTAQLQTQPAFSNAAMTGAVLGYENLVVNPAPVGMTLSSVSAAPISSIFRGTATADGNCVMSNVDLAGSSQLISAAGASNSAAQITTLLAARQSAGAVTCAVAANGRGVLTTPQPSAAISAALSADGLTATAAASRVFYLVAPDRGYFLETGYAALGSFEPQAAVSFSSASLSGIYRFGTGSPASASSTGSSGIAVADGASRLQVTPDAGLNASGQPVTGTSQTLTYALTDTVAGRFTANNLLLYALSPNRFLQINVDPSVVAPSIGTMQR